MEIDYHYINDILIVNVPDGNGRLIEEDLEDFIEEIIKHHKGESKGVALNMSMKSYLNSSGLGELIKVNDYLADKQIILTLINPTSRVESLIKMVGVDQFFNIVSSEDEL